MDPHHLWTVIVKNGQDNTTFVSEYKEIIVAIIAVFGTIVGVVLPYVSQKNRELINKIADQKRDAYAAFMKNFTEISRAAANDQDISDTELDRERALVRDALILYASDEVIKAYVNWIRHGEDDAENLDIDKETELVGILFLAIRKDILGSTRVKRMDLDELNSYNRG